MCDNFASRYPPEIRKVIYTTNAIESINMSLRKVIRTRALFSTDEIVSKLFYLALSNIGNKVDDAKTGLESGLELFQYPVRGPVDSGLIYISFTHNPRHPPLIEHPI